MAQLVGHLPKKCEALKPQYSKTKQNKKPSHDQMKVKTPLNRICGYKAYIKKVKEICNK
jgi:hypothetical protein